MTLKELRLALHEDEFNGMENDEVVFATADGRTHQVLSIYENDGVVVIDIGELS
jgi:hypothetical protein